jgi:mRNA interferase MazF
MPSTTRYRRGDIVLVSFPFTDLSSSKRRPALVISPDSFNDTGQDLVLVAITSQKPGDNTITIDPSDCVAGVLPKQSFVKISKLFTVHSTLVLRRMCALRDEKLEDALLAMRDFFSSPNARN